MRVVGGVHVAGVCAECAAFMRRGIKNKVASVERRCGGYGGVCQAAARGGVMAHAERRRVHGWRLMQSAILCCGVFSARVLVACSACALLAAIMRHILRATISTGFAAERNQYVVIPFTELPNMLKVLRWEVARIERSCRDPNAVLESHIFLSARGAILTVCKNAPTRERGISWRQRLTN